MSLAAKLPYSHPYANGFGYGGTNVPTDTDGLDYLSRMATADGAGLETGIAGAIDRFIKACKADDIWDSIRSSCILAGARSLNGALVPLRDYGPELWDAPTPTIATASGASPGSWDAASQTMSCTLGTNANYPRFGFDLGLVVGSQYVVSGRLSGDTAKVTETRLCKASCGAETNISYNSSTGLLSGTATAGGTAPVLEIAIDGTLGPASVTIESLSIREVIDDPINSPVGNGFTSGDYSRTSGLTGDGTSYIDSERASDDDPQNDSHWSVYPTALGTPAKALIHTDYTAANEDVSGFVFNQAPNTSVIRSRIGSVTGTPQALVATYEPSNLIAASRASGTEFTRRYNGTSEPVTASSATPQALNYFVFARQNGAGVELVSDATIAFYSIGTSLGTDPAVGLADLDTAVTNLMADITFFFNTGLNPADYDTETVRYVNAGYAAGGTLE